MKNEWNISPDFVYSWKQNKAAEVAIGEVEENAFRYSGRFNKHDILAIEKMLEVGRNETLYDRKWSEIDRKCLREFLDDANCHDDRIDMFERWFVRKQREIDSRYKLPTEYDLLTDK